MLLLFFFSILYKHGNLLNRGYRKRVVNVCATNMATCRAMVVWNEWLMYVQHGWLIVICLATGNPPRVTRVFLLGVGKMFPFSSLGTGTIFHIEGDRATNWGSAPSNKGSGCSTAPFDFWLLYKWWGRNHIRSTSKAVNKCPSTSFLFLYSPKLSDQRYIQHCVNTRFIRQEPIYPTLSGNQAAAMCPAELSATQHAASPIRSEKIAPLY